VGFRGGYTYSLNTYSDIIWCLECTFGPKIHLWTKQTKRLTLEANICIFGEVLILSEHSGNEKLRGCQSLKNSTYSLTQLHRLRPQGPHFPALWLWISS
jgi:hypothetical protein